MNNKIETSDSRRLSFTQSQNLKEDVKALIAKAKDKFGENPTIDQVLKLATRSTDSVSRLRLEIYCRLKKDKL
jgi:hypothetical protein